MCWQCCTLAQKMDWLTVTQRSAGSPCTRVSRLGWKNGWLNLAVKHELAISCLYIHMYFMRIFHKISFYDVNINGILLPKLFWPTVRKNCSSDREKLLRKLFSITRTSFLIVGQNNFGNKIPFILTSLKLILWNILMIYIHMYVQAWNCQLMFHC